MTLRIPTAKITDSKATFDRAPVASVEGEVIWADVWIDFALSGMAPTVLIRVPVPWNERDTPEERKVKALRCARQLMDNACRAPAVGEGQRHHEDNAPTAPVEIPSVPISYRSRKRAQYVHCRPGVMAEPLIGLKAHRDSDRSD